MKTFTEWDNWRDAIEPDLTEIIRPDLLAHNAGPVRIVFDTELSPPEHVRFAGLAWEMFSVGLSHVTNKRYAAERPGPTVLIITKSADQDFCDVEMKFNFATSTVVHEVSHCFDHRSLRGYTPRCGVETVQQFVMDTLWTDDGKLDEELHREHGIDHPRFVRRTIHLASRLIERGWQTPLIYLQNWGDVSPWDALWALGDEPSRLAGLSIREVDAGPVPAEFAALWKSSCHSAA